MKRTVFAAAIAAVLSVAVSPAIAQDLGPTLTKIRQNNTFTIGHREASVPFSALNQQQRAEGFSIDLCLKVAEAAKEQLNLPNMQVRFVPVTPQTRFALIANGTIDMECGSTTNTIARQGQAAFTATTFITGTKIMVRANSGIRSVDDLAGKTLVVLPGTTNEQALKAYIEQKRMQVRILNVRDHAEALLAMETDRADAYGSDDVLLYGSRRRSRNPAQYVVVGDFITFDPYALAVPRNDSTFLTLANRTLARMFRDGSFKATYDKWFGPLDMPLNPLLEAAIQLQAIPE